MKFLRNTLFIFGLVSALIVFQIKERIVSNGSLSQSVTVDIFKGVSSQKAAEILAENRVIDNPLLFRLFMKYRQAEGQIKAGEYLFEPHVSMEQVLDKLVRGDVLYHKVTIPEGYTMGQIVSLFASEELLSGVLEKMPEEGFILPETYTFQKGENRAEIIQKAEKAMQQKLEKIWENRDEGLPYQSMHDLLVMASIIEKETGVGDERSKVASVFVNRLRKGMLLQTDPTVIYALTGGREELGRPLLKKDLAVDNPYNTYKYAGLPPTAICNPGEASLYAAAHPAETDYLYFVANGSGGHNFAKTLGEHNRNVADWRKLQ